MKVLKNILIIGLLAGAFGSCKKDLLDINTSPNDPTTASASPGLVLPTALATTASIYDNSTTGTNNFVWAGLWMGQIGYSGNYAIATENISYNLTNSFASGTWTNIYDNIEDYDFVQQKGAASGNQFYVAIGTFMKAYNFQTLVDLYGNVPYSQALKGTAVSNPAYDNGKTIYDDLSKKMDSAIAIFKQVAASGTPSITGDIMFNKGGATDQATVKAEATSWVQFANTVKLRLLLRQSEVNGAAAKTQAAALSGGFLTKDATVNPGYLNSAGKTNPFWGANINTNGTYTQDLYRAGAYAIKYLKNNNDTFRLRKFYTPIGGISDTSLANYNGNAFGDQGSVNSKTSQIGSGVLKAYNQDAVIMLAAESYFLQAEAALRGWITGDPKVLYQKGVEASFAYLGLSTSLAQQLYTQPGNKNTTWDATSGFQEQLALIIRQKWIAETWINELEPYNDYRRLHLPADLPLSTSSTSTGIFPARLLYPQREYDVNGTNVLAQGTVTPGTKVWWMP
jgi:hypothetical protein